MNVINYAINHSIKFAQKRHNFAYLEDEYDLSVNSIDGVTEAAIKQNGTTKVIKAIKSVRTADSEIVNSRLVSLSGVTSSSEMIFLVNTGEKYFAYQGDKRVTEDFKLIAYSWLPELTEDSDSNIFTEFHSDWLLHSALMHLNIYVREDEKIELRSQFLSTQWQTVLNWDSQRHSAQDYDLE